MNLSDIKGNDNVSAAFVTLLDPISRIASDTEFYDALHKDRDISDARTASIDIIVSILKPCIVKHQEDFAEIFSVIDSYDDSIEKKKSTKDYIPQSWDEINSFAFRAVSIVRDPVFLGFLR